MFEYIIDLDEVKRLVGEKVVQLENDIDSLLVYVKITTGIDLTFSDVLCICEGTVDLVDFSLDDSLINERVSDIKNLLNDIFNKFKQETEVDLQIELRITNSDMYAYFTLDLLEVVIDGTIQKKETEKLLENLKSKNVKFDCCEVGIWTF